jgi:hypothetical protein
MDVLAPILFFVVWGGFMLLTFGGMFLGIAALVSAARLPDVAFGPWWDNTKALWLVGLAVGFLVPFGSVIAGSYWFFGARRPLSSTGLVARPFWAGPPKPPPPWAWGPPPAPPPPPGPPPSG